MKRGRKKGGSKDKVFGCDLLEHLSTTSQEIPHVLRSCSEFIEVHGIVDGIYRLSGVSSNTQKLRSEFDSEGNPDLNKEVYLQDIHCVSSLCKAYFRELPNPLLTYQLYDRFADAVAVQLEDERLVKIKEVLKELPSPHYKTLEYLMRHLVKMSTFSAQTNMHARNLAIVWAPNLLRSKDIEATGFNGTAAFMEVRVQSIVVEFVLTHVSQLFPESDTEPGLTLERRKSLPSPSALLGQEDHFFRATQYPGNLSPGDGPPAMRPYHAIIDGTDKRKGSLKGRKWRSIFNLGGRLQDPRKKNKYTTKEKEKTALRPAKSMDSLSSGPYTLEDPRHSSSHLSPLVTSSGTTEGGNTGSGGMSSGYAVTYRRTGGASVSMVSGGGGTQGTYKSLDTGGAAGADRPQATSQVAASKAERRAGMHISGPFSVTVPLHITSGLALGVLHGGRNEEELPQQGVTDEEQPKNTKQESTGGNEQLATMQIDHKTGSNQEDDAEDEVKMNNDENDPSEGKEKYEVKIAGSEERVSQCDGDYLSEDETSSTTQLVKDRPSLTEDIESDYMDMKPGVQKDSPQNEMTHNPLCKVEEYPDQELPLDFQDTFGFLDLMDTSTTNQQNEFSVEPPGFEEEEDEDEEEDSTENNLLLSETNFMHRPLPGKSHSLPYKSRPFQPLPSFSSDEDDYSGPDDDDDDDDEEDNSDKADYEDMFCKSLPSSQHFHGLNWTCPQLVTLNSTDCSVESNANNQSECQNQTCITELTERSHDLLPGDQSECLTKRDAQTTPSNGVDTHAIDQGFSEGDLSPLPLEPEHFNVDERNTVDISTKESESEEGEHINQPIQETNEELERTANEDLHIFSQEEKHSMTSEDKEDTYFGPDAISTLPETSSIETSFTSDQLPVKKENTSVDSQQAGSEGCLDITAGEEILIDEPDLSTGATSLTSQDETNELSMEQTLTVHNEEQDKTDISSSGEEGLDQISLVEDNVVKQDVAEREQIKGEENSVVSEDRQEVSAMKVVCEISREKKQEHERETTEKVESEEVEEDAKHEFADCFLKKEIDEVGGQEKTVLEKNEDGAEKLTTREGKKGRDGEEESDEQMDKDDMGEEAEAIEDSHLEGVTEIKEGSIPEQRIVREREDRLSDDSVDFRVPEVLLGEQEKEGEDKIAKDQTIVDESSSGAEKPLRLPRMKELEGGKDVGLGQGVGRTLVMSKNPPTKVYHVKAVPVVPPKPQHSKITAFKQQFQQRDSERQHLDKGVQHRDIARHQQDDTKDKEMESSDKGKDPREAENHDHRNSEQGNGIEGQKVEENKAKMKDSPSGEMFLSLGWEDQRERRGTWDGGSYNKDGQKDLDRETKRASGISICFDEAVARATGKRCREKDDRFIDLQWEKGDQKDGLTQRKREEEGKFD